MTIKVKSTGELCPVSGYTNCRFPDSALPEADRAQYESMEGLDDIIFTNYSFVNNENYTNTTGFIENGTQNSLYELIQD